VTLTLEQAEQALNGALLKSAEAGFEPLTIAVLDAGGHLVVLKRQDGSGILRAEIAIGKAYGALGFGLGSRSLADKNSNFLAAVANASGGRLVPVPGGVLVRDSETNRIIGAMGVSGDSSGNDEMAAVFGIEGAGLLADPG